MSITPTVLTGNANSTVPTAANLNGLRAAIMGANDGIISVATVLIAVLGVFGAREVALTAGAVLFAGALSMAAGEFVSVSAQIHKEEPGKSCAPEGCAAPGSCAAVDTGLGRSAALQAAVVSFLAFFAGGVLPVLAAVVFGVPLLVVAVSLGLLLLTGAISADPKARVRSTLILFGVGTVAFGISYAANLILQRLGV